MGDASLPKTYLGFAQAALGEFSSARRTLLVAPPRGDGLDRDFTLCAEVLICAFERNLDEALHRAVELVQLPVYRDEERHRVRRLAVVSVARLLAGVCEEEDWSNLEAAASSEPVMVWACRYAAAVEFARRGRAHVCKALLVGAPEWPPESHFAPLHRELTSASLASLRRIRAA
jgi:hypothetical protein